MFVFCLALIKHWCNFIFNRYKDKTATFDMDIDESLFDAAKAEAVADEIDESLFAAEAENAGGAEGDANSSNDDEQKNDGGGDGGNNNNE